MAASQNKSFLKSGQEPGVEIWRIENFEAVPIDQKSYGQFYSGDSYLVLETTKNKYGRLKRNLFFWLGSTSTQDEKGTAAYKAVELDDVHKGEPVQYREIEGHESQMFQAVFKKSGGVRVLKGGKDSGFNHVDPDAYEPRLFQCKGKRSVLVSQVEMKSSSLNEGDVFILDCGLTLYRWIGSKANKYEKFKSMEVANKIKDEERGGKATIVILDKNNSSSTEAEPFWKMLGDKSQVKSAEAGGADAVRRAKPTLIEISDASGKMDFKQVKVTTKSGKLEKSLLRYQKYFKIRVACGVRPVIADADAAAWTEDVFLIDVQSKIYVWIGKGATKAEKKESMKYATDYLKEKGYPDWISVQRVTERAEPPAFKELFHVWSPPKERKVEDVKEGGGGAKPKDVAAEALFKVCKEAEEKMIDTSGKVTQWRVEDLKRVEVPAGMKGQFFDGDSYVILYSYTRRNRPEYIIYYWQGSKSSIDEKAASALLTRDLDDAYKGKPVQVRVTMGHEPKHFMAIFGGKMVIRNGGHASAFKNRNDQDKYDTDGTEMYHVKSQGASYTRTIQCEEKASALNSGDCFVLLTPKQMYIWQGAGANDEERKSAADVADTLRGSRSITVIKEGDESEDFWSAIGGKGEYAKSKFLSEDVREPRLFHLSTNTGGLTAQEVFNFTQEDLINDDVMMLDLFSEVYVWCGSDAQSDEKDSALKLALDYAKNNPDGREECPVFKLEAGFEPPSFTAHFIAWDEEVADKWVKGDAKGSDMKKTTGKAVSSSDVGFLDPATNKFSLKELQVKGKQPDRVNPAKKELYLEDKVFKEIFGVTMAEFAAWKPWKQQAAKKKHSLF
eukprot:jgi/Bigna1/86413/estExt_fgenesh1_pg.C_100194